MRGSRHFRQGQHGPKFTRDLPEIRRQQLIEATARCLARDGLAGTSVRHVAAEAGVSPGLVRHHFEGMQDLVAETYRATGKQIAAILDEALAAAGPSAEARLHAFIETSFKPPLLDADLLAVWLAFWSLHAHRSRDPQDPCQGLCRLSAPARDDDRRARAREHSVAIETKQASLALTALLDGLWLEHCLDPKTFSARRGRRHRPSLDRWLEEGPTVLVSAAGAAAR